jgi:hypothetical protein
MGAVFQLQPLSHSDLAILCSRAGLVMVSPSTKTRSRFKVKGVWNYSPNQGGKWYFRET